MTNATRFLFGFLVAFIVQVGTVYGGTCGCLTDCCLFDDLEVGVDVLYWHACKTGQDYAAYVQEENGVTDVDYLSVEYRWDPGFRIHLASPLGCHCDYQLMAHYTYFWTRQSDSADCCGDSPTTLYLESLYNPSGFPVGQLMSINTLHYQTVDLLVGRQFSLCEGHCINTFFGLQGLRLEQNIDSRVPDCNLLCEIALWNSDYKALGFELGTDYRLSWMCGLDWIVRGAFSVVAGYQESEAYIETFVNQEEFFAFCDIISDYPLCTPGVHLQTGLSYKICYCGRHIDLHLGYEFINWWNLPQIRKLWQENIFDGTAGAVTGAGGGSTSDNGSNLMLHGLYGGIRVGF